MVGRDSHVTGLAPSSLRIVWSNDYGQKYFIRNGLDEYIDLISGILS